jgi:mRNA interferase MazF
VVETPKRDEVWLIALDPTRGSEIQKTRPCVVVSPDEMNRHLRTIVIAPMTSAVRRYPTRVDRSRLLRKLGNTTPKTAGAISDVLVEMFARG